MAAELNLKGTGVAMVTPFNANGQVDLAGLERLTEHLIDGRVEYLVVMGTTGESVTLSKEEKKSVLKAVLATNAGRIPVVLGVGGNNTAEVCQELRQLDTTGLSAILSVSPAYNKPTQDGIYAHYRAVSEASPLPIILYNVPGRTGSNMSAATTLRLAHDFVNIIGIKEASGSVEQCIDILKRRPSDFLVISGDDNLTLPLIACGADGVISVVGNAFPRAFSDLTRAAMANDLLVARSLQYRLFDIINMLFAEGNPGGVKCALKELGICEEHMRLPLVPVSDTLRSKLTEYVRAFF
ncbi:MAG: 4-hydroxy-tetrahydrodipicolinate synthase [Flavobacteriales bacterium]|nr:4-hydroxy-tetrahydrodipicolinate synthase [Flavobacteriales bacterium]